MLSRGNTIKALLLAAALCCGAAEARAALNPYIIEAGSASVSFGWFGSGVFNVALSTTPAFTPRLSSGTVTGNSTAYFSLSYDTTHYFRVKQQGAAEGAYETLSVSTWAAAPASPFFNPSRFSAPSSFTATAGLGWDTAGNPSWTSYEVQYATAADFTGARAGVRTIPYYTGDVSVGALDANTTYYFRVRSAAFRGAYSPYSSAIATATPALGLTTLDETVYETSATITWNQVRSLTVPALDSEGYRLLYAQDEQMTSPSVWSTASDTLVSTAASGLSRNTRYYYQAGALNVIGAANYFERQTFMTLPSKPSTPVRVNIGTWTAALGWTAFPAAPAAASASGYRLEASTSNFTGGTLLSSVTYALSQSTLTVTLDSNTTYYFRAAALNADGGASYSAAVSSVTLAPAIPANLTLSQAGAQAITVFFTPNPDSPQSVTCEGYLLQASTAPFGAGGTVRSSATTDSQLSALTVTSLMPHTSYYLRLGSLNWRNAPNYTGLDTLLTLTGSAPVAPALVSLSSASAVIGFTPVPLEGPNGYVAEASTYSQFNNVYASSVTLDASTGTLRVDNLLPNTLYYFRVGALFNGATEYALTAPAFAYTLPRPLSGVQVYDTDPESATLSWAAAPEAAYYRVDAATDSSFAELTAVSSTTDPMTTGLVVSGLLPNTSYYLRAGAFNSGGSGTYILLPATATLAYPAAWLPATIGSNSITVNWDPGANPPDTRFRAEISSTPGFTPYPAVFSATTTLAYAAFNGLLPNTPYYSRVTGINRLNREMQTTYFSSVATGALDPGGATASGRGVSSMTVTWTNGGNITGTWYTVRISSDPGFAGAVASSVTLATSATFYGLISDARYYLNVSAMNLDFAPTDPPVGLGNMLTRPAAPRILTVLSEAFNGLMTDGFTFEWGHNGNAGPTAYNVEIATAQDFAVFTASAAVAGSTACVFTGLPMNTTYWARVQTAGQDGSLTAFASTGTVRTLNDARLSATSLRENLLTLDTSYGTFSVFMPAGSLGGSTMLYLVPESTFPAAASAVAELTPTGVGLSVTKGSPVLVLSAITVSIPYRDEDMAGFDRGRLVLALYDEPNDTWIPLPSVSDTAGRKVTGQTWHLSTFQIMQATPQAGLSEAKIYPNPYRPNTVTDVMHFTNLPPRAKVKLYTFLGELVRELKADVNGMTYWDGRNGAGERAASGVYIAFIQSADRKKSRTVKIAVER